MSGSSYKESDRVFTSYSVLSDTSATRGELESFRGDRRERVVRSREALVSSSTAPPPPPRVARDVAAVRDPSLVRLALTHPSPAARRAVVVLVDNSGSNREIASHIRNSSGHFAAMARLADAQSETAFIYFSDHCDGEREQQAVDFVPANDKGDRQLFSTLEQIHPASGGDEPEAIECALHAAAEIDFAHVPRENRMLILVSDVVPHGMEGVEKFGVRDDGCPNQRSWRRSMEEVRAAYGEFVFIGSGSSEMWRSLQLKLFETAPGVSDPEEVAVNFIDFSTIRSQAHRNGLVGNAITFVLARRAGRQPVLAFLSALYEKWLANPIFGRDSDGKARDRITNMARLYLRKMMTNEEIEQMLREVFAD